MTEVDVETAQPAAEREVVHVHEIHDGADSATESGVNLVAVLLALVVLVCLVAVMFYVLPGLVGTSNVTINVRTQ